MKKLILSLVLLALALQLVSAQQCFPNYVCGEWSECADGFQTRICKDTTCNQRDLVERSFCNKPDCTPKIECGEWSQCTYTEKTDNLIQGKISFGGYRTRVCRDAGGCVDSFIQEGNCEETYSLQLVSTTKCDQNLVEVIDPLSQREIAKINLDSWKENKLDISFTQGSSSYCPSCYNTVRDGNEQGVDCGGDCKPCKVEHAYIRPLALAFLWLLVAFFVFLSYREINSTEKKDE